MIIDEDYIIEHFGVKGQKWGVRNAKTNSKSKPVTRDRARKSINKGDAAMKALLIGLGTVNVGLIVAAHKIR